MIDYKKIKRGAAMLLATASLLGMASCGGMTGATSSSNPAVDWSKIEVPEYTSTKRVEFCAYGSPTNARWDGSSANAEGLTDESYKLMADGGFTTVQPLFEGYLRKSGATIEEISAKAEEDAMKALALCEKYGLTYCVRDWTFYGFVNKVSAEDTDAVLEKMFRKENPYVSHPNWIGNNLHDEPDMVQLEKLVPVVDKFLEMYPDKDCFVNLNPIYATADQLKLKENETYVDYVKYYCDNIGEKLGYVSYDYYPLFKSQYGTYVKSTYLQNFEIVAQEAKARDIDFRLYIQTAQAFPGSSRDIVGVQDYRFQIYTAMAFGVDYFMYYTYHDTNGNDIKEALVDVNCKPTFRYYAAKTVNNEVHAWENVFTSFDWEGVMCYDGDIMRPNEAFEYLEQELESHERIESVDAKIDTVIGTFKDQEDRDGFMIVNYTDPYNDQTGDVTVKFKDAQALLMYRYGQKVVVPLKADGSYTFKLEPGEGRFVIPLKAEA